MPSGASTKGRPFQPTRRGGPAVSRLMSLARTVVSQRSMFDSLGKCPGGAGNGSRGGAGGGGVCGGGRAAGRGQGGEGGGRDPPPAGCLAALSLALSRGQRPPPAPGASFFVPRGDFLAPSHTSCPDARRCG